MHVLGIHAAVTNWLHSNARPPRQHSGWLACDMPMWYRAAHNFSMQGCGCVSCHPCCCMLVAQVHTIQHQTAPATGA